MGRCRSSDDVAVEGANRHSLDVDRDAPGEKPPPRGDGGPRRGLAARSAGLVAGQGATWVFALAWIAIVPRDLGTDGFGRFVFAHGVLTIAVGFGMFGIEVWLSRAAARRDPDEEVAAGIQIGLLGVTGSVVLATAAAAMAAPSIALGLGIGTFGFGIGNLAFAILQGRERPELRAGMDVVAKGVFFAGSVLALMTGTDLAGIGAAYAVGYAAYAVVGWAAIRRAGLIPPLRAATRAHRGAVLRSTAPLGVHHAGQAIYYRADSAMLTPLRGAAQTGLYGAAFRLFDTASFVTSVFGSVFSPRLMQAGANDREELRRQSGLAIKAMSALGLVAAVGFAVTAEPVVQLLYGDDFAGAVTPLRILGIALGLSFVATPLTWALIAVDRQAVVARTSIVAAVVNVAANVVAIPMWGASGAAATTSLTEIVVLAILSFEFRAVWRRSR